MKTIWKYELEITDTQTLEVPEGSVPLAVGVQSGKLCLWLLVTGGQAMASMHVAVVGTGNPIQFEGFEYIGTAQMPPFVWHVFATKV